VVASPSSERVRAGLTEIEAGRKNITLHTLYALADHFGIDPADLLRPEPNTVRGGKKTHR
jgi:transcriptional regulator with XRE-family HTH domain